MITTPEHWFALIPQSINDTWEARCLCGFQARISLQMWTREDAIAMLKAAAWAHAPGATAIPVEEYFAASGDRP